MIKRFSKTEGVYIEKIPGQKRLAFSLSDTADFYDLEEWADHGGYPGMVISFYDLKSGKVYTPFEKKRNVVFSKPKFLEGNIYFLKGDYDKGSLVLYRFYPEEGAEKITELSLMGLRLYNLNIMGEKVHIASQEDDFCCYYPESFSFEMGENESAVLILDGKVYCQEWVEEGWDEENNCAKENYKYYDNLIVRDFEGNILSKEKGSLFEDDDGNWWIS